MCFDGGYAPICWSLKTFRSEVNYIPCYSEKEYGASPSENILIKEAGPRHNEAYGRLLKLSIERKDRDLLKSFLQPRPTSPLRMFGLAWRRSIIIWSSNIMTITSACKVRPENPASWIPGFVLDVG